MTSGYTPSFITSVCKGSHQWDACIQKMQTGVWFFGHHLRLYSPSRMLSQFCYHRSRLSYRTLDQLRRHAAPYVRFQGSASKVLTAHLLLCRYGLRIRESTLLSQGVQRGCDTLQCSPVTMGSCRRRSYQTCRVVPRRTAGTTYLIRI